MNRHIYSVQIRVLLCPEDRGFVARALEMDLLGYGTTEVEAIEELKGMVESQISFAHQMNDPNLIYFPAEEQYFKRWEVAQSSALRRQISGDKSGTIEGQAVMISFSDEELKTLRGKRFKKSDLVCA